jgi:ribosomal protein S18 acetylase RimI-like enzyme
MDIFIRTVRPKEHRELARVLHEAFAKDEPLYRALKLSHEKMIHFWQTNARLYVALEEISCLGAYENDRLAGAAVGWHGDFSPPLDLSWLYGWRYLQRLRPAALWRMGRFYYDFTRRAKPTQPCIRLINIGVDDAHRGQGIGGRLLTAFEREAVRRNIPRVQLECEEINPALRLYQRSGYAGERTFRAAGVDWQVMVKPV